MKRATWLWRFYFSQYRRHSYYKSENWTHRKNMGGDQDTSIGAERVKEAWLQILMADFDRLKMKDTATIDEFVGELSKISSKSAALGEDMEEANLAKIFLKSLPYKKYIHIVATLEQVMDLKTTSFEDIIGWLKAYEE